MDARWTRQWHKAPGTNLYSAHARTHESSIRAQLYNWMMIWCSYSGPSERAKSRELGLTCSGFYLSKRLVPSPYGITCPPSHPPDVTHVMNEPRWWRRFFPDLITTVACSWFPKIKYTWVPFFRRHKWALATAPDPRTPSWHQHCHLDTHTTTFMTLTWDPKGNEE